MTALPSNAELAAVYRALFGEQVIIQGSPQLVAGATLTAMRMAIALGETDKCERCGHPRREHTYNGACYGLCGEFVTTREQPARFDGEKALAEFEAKRGDAVREQSSKQYRESIDRVNRATDAEIAAAVSSSKRDAL